MNNECTNDRFLCISVHKYQQSVFDDLLIQFPQSQGIKHDSDGHRAAQQSGIFLNYKSWYSIRFSGISVPCE